MRPFWSAFAVAALAPWTSARADVVPHGLSVIAVAPAKTSIYIGRLTVTPGLFVHDASGYNASLGIDLWPYGYHEDAKVGIAVSAETLARLERGESVEFAGRVTRRNGQTRRVTGRAVPTGPDSGTIEVRVFLGGKISVSFSTTYRSAVPPPPR
jgi:hypothetical protein